MASGYPDWTRAIRLLGIDAEGNPVTVLLDDDGRMYSLIMGEDAGGDPRAVAVDTSGQIIMVPRGSTGNYMAVDASGFLTAILKGTEGANVRSVVVDTAGNLVAVMKGLEGANLRTIAVDASGQIIMVPRGSSGNYMLIDSDGYMTAVLKGDYDGALRTIGLDDDGRITAYMADDESQWGDVVKVGNAELAARLGSVLSWDWRGQVLVAHDFSKGLDNLYSLDLGAGAAVEIDPTAFISGGYSVKLTTGRDGDQNAGLRGRAGLTPSLSLGLSTGWLSDGSFEFINLMLLCVHDGVRHYAYIRYATVTEKLQYYDENSAWQDIAELNILFGTDIFHRMKVVADLSTGFYVRALFDGVEYDLSTIPLREVEDNASEYIAYHAYLYGFEGANNTANIDMLTLTVREPA